MYENIVVRYKIPYIINKNPTKDTAI